MMPAFYFLNNSMKNQPSSWQNWIPENIKVPTWSKTVAAQPWEVQKITFLHFPRLSSKMTKMKLKTKKHCTVEYS